MLKQELDKMEENFLIASYTDENGKEMEFVVAELTQNGRHITMKLRDGGQGYVKQ